MAKFIIVSKPSGVDPKKILECKFYATRIYKATDWLKNLTSQSKCLKNSCS